MPARAEVRIVPWTSGRPAFNGLIGAVGTGMRFADPNRAFEAAVGVE